MTYQELDQIFPYFVFFYGLVVTMVLNMPELIKIGNERLPKEMMTQFQSHRLLALISLIVGGLWSLQNIWL